MNIKSFIKRILFSINDKTFFSKVLYRFYWFYFKLFGRFYKININNVVCQNFLGRGYADNPKYLVEELHKKHPYLNIFWLVNSKFINDEKQFPSYIKVIPYYSFNALKELSKAKVWIDNCRGCASRVPKKNNQIYIQLWHGFMPLKTIEKDAEKNLDSKYVCMAKKDSTYTDLCVSGCSFMTKIYHESFWYSGEILECGTPRNDIFFKKTDFILNKNKLGIDKNKKLCLYAPTFRANDNTFDYSLNYDKIYTTLNNKFGGEWIILTRLHPNIIKNHFISSLPFYVKDVSLYPDVQEILSVTDCLISDFSSIMFDFMLTKRPVFIYAPDFDNYIKKERKLYYPIEETPFTISRNCEELKNHILEYNSEEYELKNKSFSNKFGFCENGQAGEKIVDWLINRIGENSNK